MRDEDGKLMTVRYEAINAMLLNEFLKEHRTVQELKEALLNQKQEFAARIASQEKEIQILAEAMRKVSNKVELSRATGRLVVAGGD